MLCYVDLSLRPLNLVPQLTVFIRPPLRCWATDFAMDGFSATQRILRVMPAIRLGSIYCKPQEFPCHDSWVANMEHKSIFADANNAQMSKGSKVG